MKAASKSDMPGSRSGPRPSRGRTAAATIGAMPAQTWVEPVVLEGSRVRMEPLSLATTSPTSPRSPSTRRSGAGRSWGRRTRRACGAGSRRALANAEAGTERPFATIDLASGRAIGSSRYMSIVPEHKRLEIGWTWLGDRVPADRRQPRGQAPPADPRVRDARRQPGRVQDPRPQRALAHGARRDRRDVRGRLPQPHRSCPTARSATPPTSASSPPEWPASRPASSPAWSADRRRSSVATRVGRDHPRGTPSSPPLPRRSHEEASSSARSRPRSRSRSCPTLLPQIDYGGSIADAHRGRRSSPAWSTG